MKLKYSLMALILISVTSPAVASRDSGFEGLATFTSCELTDLQRALLNQAWNKLSMRFFMVSMESGNNPYKVRQMRAEVDQQLAELRDEYGSDCVLDIL